MTKTNINFSHCRITVFFILLILNACKTEINMKAPLANKIPVELSKYDNTRIDNYYWLNERENPEVIKYLEEENAYFDKMMSGSKKLRESLFNEIIGRIKQSDMSVPYFRNAYYYYVRYEEGKEYPIYCRKKENLEADEEIILNVNEMAEDYAFYQIGSIAVSPDNKMIVYGVDTVGRRNYTLYFKLLETGEIFNDAIPMTIGSATWSNDNKTIFYSRKDEVTLRSYRIYKHILGTDPSDDKLIYQEDDDAFYCAVFKTKSDKYIMIVSGSTISTEYRYIHADRPDEEFKIIQARERDLEYSIEHYNDKFYIVTNLNAKNFRLMETPVDKPEKENWKEIIPHRNDIFLDGIDVFKDYLVVSERRNGLTNIRIIPWDGRQEHFIDFGEEAYLAYTSINPEFDTEKLRFGYTSLTTPNSIYEYNMNTREKVLLKREEVLGKYNPEDYETRRLYATASDGTEIPVSIVYKKGIRKNGKNPLLLYGYGSYGITIDPSFSSERLSLIDRGFIYAIAHIRGGQINGRQWYEDGKLLKKMNTFTDFNSCAEYLINEKYTSPEHLYAMGGSAGGLLMGAVINLRPDLYKGIVAAVPFVDVLTTMLDESIPLTTGEYDEWGNPNEKEYYDYILSYSPYDNIKEMNYPNILVTTGLHDSQVQYWEPAKWVAKLRELKTDDNLLLLHTNMDTGHGGASGRYQRYKETARNYAFLLMLEKIKN